MADSVEGAIADAEKLDRGETPPPAGKRGPGRPKAADVRARAAAVAPPEVEAHKLKLAGKTVGGSAFNPERFDKACEKAIRAVNESQVRRGGDDLRLSPEETENAAGALGLVVLEAMPAAASQSPMVLGIGALLATFLPIEWEIRARQLEARKRAQAMGSPPG